MRRLWGAVILTGLLVLTPSLAGCADGKPGQGNGREASPKTSPAEPRGNPDPVVLVHGLGGSPADWDAFRRWFVRDGYEEKRVVAVDLTAGRPNDENARVIARAVRKALADTGADKADLVAFSMGNLSARHYLKKLGGTAHVRAFAGIAGPNQGMDTPLTADCGPRTDTDACQMGEDSEFLQKLNAGDETPGPVRYATWRSEADDIVPADSTPLQGATNHAVPQALGHVELIGDRQVYRAVRDFLAGR
ncbi:esterase/lipase family protein [Streptomyces sp. NPDC048172]|uniref:esterase/lipase family protein n=1 Tax=Streptomyces sp. NPDC048172 TaxID=3365505 RepID=UPI00371F2038